MADVLSCLVDDLDEFAARDWSKRACLRRDVPTSLWRDLLTTRDIDRLLASPRTAVHLLHHDHWIGREAYTSEVGASPGRPPGTMVDPAEVYRHVEGGATAVLLAVHEWWPPLARVCGELGHSLDAVVGANVYVAPPHYRGSRHSDRHDVFALQLHGSKEWTVWGPPSGEEAGTEALHATLEPGTCLYVPKGHAHAVRTERSMSIHLTFGVQSTTWRDLITRAIGSAALPDALDVTTPLRLTRASEARYQRAAATILDLVRDAVVRLDAETVVRATTPALGHDTARSWDGYLLDLLTSSDRRERDPTAEGLGTRPGTAP